MAGRVVNIRNEPCEVYIGRPSKWGNPFRINRTRTREQAIEEFRNYLKGKPELIAMARRELAGKTLGCFCAPLPCHGDVLLEFAEGRA